MKEEKIKGQSYPTCTTCHVCGKSLYLFCGKREQTEESFLYCSYKHVKNGTLPANKDNKLNKFPKILLPISVNSHLSPTTSKQPLCGILDNDKEKNNHANCLIFHFLKPKIHWCTFEQVLVQTTVLHSQGHNTQVHRTADSTATQLIAVHGLGP